MKPVIVELCIIENPYFGDELGVFTFSFQWDFPFLPRIGENISPWVWMKHLDLSKVEKLLTDKGKQNYKSFMQYSKKCGFKDWLYDAACETDYVSSITYVEFQESDISVRICLCDNPSSHSS